MTRHGSRRPREDGGRGAVFNPANRFDRISYERDPDVDDAPGPLPRTRFIPDASRSIIASNTSPDIPFERSVNPYRGCEHGCVYCYARPFHELLGYSSGLDFESVILVKEHAPALLRDALSAPRYVPRMLEFSGVTDPYQPVERVRRLTRACLEVLRDFRHPVSVITKNHLVTRDIDVLGELAAHRCVAVYLSITTLDPDLATALEPRTSTPARRLHAVRMLREASIPVGVSIAPVIPGLTDIELPAIVRAAAEAGAQSVSYQMLRLPRSVADLFEDWLGRTLPDGKAKILHRIRSIRNGKLNESEFGERMRGRGPMAQTIDMLFSRSCMAAGVSTHGFALSHEMFRIPPGGQLELFDSPC
jgi:DNA repair photolyase